MLLFEMFSIEYGADSQSERKVKWRLMVKSTTSAILANSDIYSDFQPQRSFEHAPIPSVVFIHFCCMNEYDSIQ